MPPAQLDLSAIDEVAARRTRSIIMFLGPLMHRLDLFELPYAGGCDLGTRTVEPHMTALRPFGLEMKATEGSYQASVTPAVAPRRPIVLTERGDTVTENALLAAALHPGETVIRNASSNYMVQDLCFFLSASASPSTASAPRRCASYGRESIDVDVDYSPSEDPIEAMSLLAAAIVTESEITIRRVPIEFLEIELAVLEEMGLDYDRSPEYLADNGETRLIDLTTKPSVLHSPIDKIHPMPFPGLNIDNLPFFAVIAAVAEGQTMLHDWVYENRAIYLTELKKLRRAGQAARPAPGDASRARPAGGHRDRVSAGAAARRRHPAGDARLRGDVGAAVGLRHQPRLRGPRRAPQRAGCQIETFRDI